MTEFFNFEDFASDELRSPLDKKNLIDVAREIPSDIIEEYVDGSAYLIANLYLYRDIFASIYNPERCAILVDRLNELQLAHISRILFYLRDRGEIEDYKQIYSVTVGNEVETEGARQKAIDFFRSIKTCNVDFNAKAMHLKKHSKLFETLANVLIIATFPEKFDELAIGELLKLSEDDFISVQKLALTILK